MATLMSERSVWSYLKEKEEISKLYRPVSQE